MNSINHAYRNGHAGIRDQFTTPPEALGKLSHQTQGWPHSLAQAVTTFQKELSVDKAPLSGEELVIVTGQQPGLFTGPLYTILKAMTAIQAAESIHSQGVPCIPVFWVAGDDHDFEEVQTAHFLDTRDALFSLTYTTDDPGIQTGDIPMYRMPLSGQLHTLIDTAATRCRNSEQTPGVREFLHDSLGQSRSLSHWFCLLMARMFSDTPLRLFEPSLPEARTASVSVLRKEIEAPLHTTRLLLEEGKKLEAMGFQAPIQRDEHACNFFLEVEERRRKVLFKQGRYWVRESETPYSVEDMATLLRESPERFSPNVALRPVVQQSLFSPVAYVAGPGEIEYWAQLKPLFALFEVPMPIVYPRLHAAITSTKLRQIMERYGLLIHEIMGDTDLLPRMLQTDRDPDSRDTFLIDRTQMESAVDQFVANITASSPLSPYKRAADAFHRNMQFQLQKLERAFLYADKERRTVAESRLNRLRNTLYPLGMPQERVLSPFSFLFHYGWPLIERMLSELDYATTNLQEMEL